MNINPEYGDGWTPSFVNLEAVEAVQKIAMEMYP